MSAPASNVRGPNLHALHPECNKEDNEGGEDQSEGCPDELPEQRLLRSNAEIRGEDGHLDETRSQYEEGLSGHGCLSKLVVLFVIEDSGPSLDDRSPSW